MLREAVSGGYCISLQEAAAYQLIHIIKGNVAFLVFTTNDLNSLLNLACECRQYMIFKQ